MDDRGGLNFAKGRLRGRPASPSAKLSEPISVSPDVPCDLCRRRIAWIDEARREVDDLHVNSVEEDRLIGQVQARLTDKYPEVLAESVAAAINEARAQFDGRRVRDFVPLFVERIANTKLASLVSS